MVRANKRFKCETCGKTSNDPYYLKKHIAAYHSDQSIEKFKCDICGLLVTSKPYLKKHKSIIHEKKKKNYRCDICKKYFTEEDSYKIHVNTLHGVINSDENQTFFNYCNSK